MKKPYTLFTPGPVEIEKEVRKELNEPLLYHRERIFSEIFAEVIRNLKRLIFTKGKIFILTASGTGAMEASVQNLVSKNERALVISYGVFGSRWKELLWRYGVYVDEIAYPYGQSPPLEEIVRRLRTSDQAKFVFTTLTETSTGMLSQIEEIGKICRAEDRLLVVDGICGLGADKFYMDKWQVDVFCGASQKALASPPGLSFVAVGERAWEAVTKAKSPRYYFDFRIYDKFLNDLQTPYTPAILTLYALRISLKKILSLGVKRLWEKHKQRAEIFRRAMGNVEYLPDNPSNALTVIKMPEGKDSTKIIREIKERYKMLFANGQRELKGKLIRVGHMGDLKKKDLLKAAEVIKRYLF
ncbi:MAG: alanine--glyoxylate aminotransferase family protein [candidate division WOR-3 bacterium]